jgi:hypothetical protein
MGALNFQVQLVIKKKFQVHTIIDSIIQNLVFSSQNKKTENYMQQNKSIDRYY